MPFDNLDQMIEDAPAAGRNPVNFGALTVTPMVTVWTTTPEGKRQPTRTPMKETDQLGPGESLELVFNLDIQELQPNLEFTYERNVSVKKSSERLKTDWSEIVLPSLIAVFGKDWRKKVMGNKYYVEVDDVVNVNHNKSKSSQKLLSVPRILRAFPDAKSCLEARLERFPPREVEGVPKETIAAVKELIEGSSKTAARKVLLKKPYGNYDPDLLIRLATGEDDIPA